MNTELSKYLYLREDVHQPLRKKGGTLYDCRKEVVSWYRNLDSEQQALHAILTGQVLGLLGATSYHQIQSIIEDPEKRKNASNNLILHLSHLYGIDNPGIMWGKLKDYSSDANAVRDHLQWVLSYEGCSNLEMTNEIRAYKDPTDLILLSMDGRWHPKARWDGKIKLQLMGIDASIDKRERDLNIENQFQGFVDWLNMHVWNPESLLGESSGSYLISTHDPETWACVSTSFVTEAEGVKLQLQPFQKKTHLLSRNFEPSFGPVIDTYVSIRDKPRVMKMIKMLRKKAEDPAIAVDDDTGLLVVVKDFKSAKSFVRHLLDRGYQSNYPIVVEDISNTLDGREHNGRPGSSSKLRMMKFFIRLANKMRVECIIHTPETYAESLYMKGVSHLEYEVNRLIDAGVPNMIYPMKYYPYFDIEEAKKQAISRVRTKIESPMLQTA